jgi:hypothetical protein
MMKIKFLALGLLAVAMTSCDNDLCIDGRGPVFEQELQVDNFIGFDLMEAGDVTVYQGTEQKVLVRAEANIFDRLETDVRSGVWEIDLGRGCFRDYELSIEITVTDLEEVILSGSGDIYIDDFDDQEELLVDISGSGDIEIGSFSGTEEIDISISGSGNIDIVTDFPDLEEMNINISGSGKVKAFPAETRNCYINISGSGSCEVSVTDLLDVNISGSGSIFYKGFPMVKSKITGSGTINDAN